MTQTRNGERSEFVSEGRPQPGRPVTAIIHIRDLKIRTIIGTEPHEREKPRDLLLNIYFTYDAAFAAQSDALGHAVDYAAIYARIISRVPETRFFLLEKLAAFILDIIMEDPKIISSDIILEKAGVLPGSLSVSVRLSAERTEGRTISTARCY
jgi:D-erythro-7,8-dihydroneopterin triphosphate epimerase